MAAWTHASVYEALVARGEKQKPSDVDKYVQLYAQSTNCAVLYPPESPYASAPLHLNPNGTRRSKAWNDRVFQTIRPYISHVGGDSKNDPNQDFDHYSVPDWTAFASALGLRPKS